MVQGLLWEEHLVGARPIKPWVESSFLHPKHYLFLSSHHSQYFRHGYKRTWYSTTTTEQRTWRRTVISGAQHEALLTRKKRAERVTWSAQLIKWASCLRFNNLTCILMYLVQISAGIQKFLTAVLCNFPQFHHVNAGKYTFKYDTVASFHTYSNSHSTVLHYIAWAIESVIKQSTNKIFE